MDNHENGCENNAEASGGSDFNATSAEISNVKVVHPFQWELNPNAKPFRSVKEELRLRFQLLGQGAGGAESGNSTPAANSTEEDSTRGATSRPPRPDSRVNVNDTSDQHDVFAKFGRSKVIPSASEASNFERGATQNRFSWTTHESPRSGNVQPVRHSSPRYFRSDRISENVDMEGNMFTGNHDQDSSNTMLILARMNNKLEAQSQVQSQWSRQLYFINQKLKEVSNRLDVIEESKRLGVNCFGGDWRELDEAQLKNWTSAYGKTFVPRQQSEGEFWPYGDFDDSGLPSTSTVSESFSPAEVTGAANNNLTLNNKVPPGSRANNFYDNFRSYSQLNLLTSPKNIPTPISGARENTLSSPSESRLRDINPSGSTRRTFGTSRHPFSRTDFVENIGTKLRNQEKDMRRASQTPNNVSSIPSPSPRRRKSSVPLTDAGTEREDSSKIIIDLISIFLENNGDHQDFIFSVFERLTQVRTDADRNQLLTTFASLSLANTYDSGAGAGLPQELIRETHTTGQSQGFASSSRAPLSASSRRPFGQSLMQLDSVDSLPRFPLNHRRGCPEMNTDDGMLSGFGLQQSSTENLASPPFLEDPILERSCWAPTSGIDDGWPSARRESVDSLINNASKGWYTKRASDTPELLSFAGSLQNHPDSMNDPILPEPQLDSDSTDENDGNFLKTEPRKESLN